MPSQALADAVLAHQLDIMRLDAHTRAEVRALLDELQREIVAALANAGDATEWTKTRLRQLLQDLDEAIGKTYAAISTTTAETLTGAGSLMAQQTADAIRAALPAVRVVLPPDSFLAALADRALVQGAPAAAWWEKQAADIQFRVAAEIRSGLAAGRTTAQIIRAVAGSKTSPGVMDIARRNAAAVVQTSAASVANAARLDTFTRNADIIKALQWLTALDGHVCPQCAARADLTWANTADHEPQGHSIPFDSPPIHFNDRCVLVPITKTYAELGVDLPEAKPSATGRASTAGPVPTGTTLEQFLARKGSAYADEVLGKGRADLWRAGKITLQQLVNGDGRPLSLAALQEKYGGG